MIKNKNITIIGMTGSGKATTAEAFAKETKRIFSDTHALIETKFQKPFKLIAEEMNDDDLVQIEEDIILGLNITDNMIISPGESVIYSVKAMNFLKENSTVVFFDTPFSVIEQRIGKEYRGIIGQKTKDLKNIYDECLPLYKKYADIIISPQNTVEESVQELTSKLS